MTHRFSLLPITVWAALLLAPLLGQAQGTVVLTGKISGRLSSDTVAVSIRENPLEAHEQITYARLDSKGEFRLALAVQGPTRAELVYDDDVTELFVEPGNQLDVRFKSNDLAGTVRYKGRGAEANAFLAEMEEKFVENEGFQVLPDNIMFYELPFLEFLDYRRKEELKFLETNADGLSKAFKDFVQARITYSYANDRLTFQDLREQVVATEGRLKMSPTYYDFLNDKSLIENTSASSNGLYQEFLLNYIHHLATSGGKQRTDPDFYQKCYELASQRLSGSIKPIVLGRILKESFRFGHIKQSAAMLDEYRAVEKANQYYPVLKADFELHKDFAIGAPAPNFRLVSTNGDTTSLRQFAGKLVYLNFWRTTSGLALRDLPYAADLAKRFEGKNIVFLNVALDENEGAWKQLVITKKLPGMHVRAGGGLHSAVARSYGVQDVPTYFLLAEDGTFLNTRPKRLSSRAAVDEIKESFGKANTYSSTLEKK